MANRFGRLGYEGNISRTASVNPPGEQILDFVGDNITTHYNEEIFSKSFPRFSIKDRYDELGDIRINGGQCNDVKVGRG